MNSNIILAGVSQTWLRVALVATLAAAVAARAGDANEPRFGTIGLTVEQGYDNNVFWVARGPLHNVAASVSTAALHWEKTLQGVGIRYAVEAVRFGGAAATEDHVRQSATIAGSGKREGAAWNFSSQTAAVDGEDTAPRFVTGRSCFAIAPARERRDQWQNRSLASWRLWQGHRFVRVAGSFTGFDMRTDTSSGSGVDTYVDRSDLNGGVDLGGGRATGFSAWLGYRRGWQYQDRDGGRISARSNHYDRLVLGVDGKLGKRLKLAGELGPEEHHYAPGSTGLREIERLHADLTGTWNLGRNDALHVATKRLQNVASTGNVSSQEYTHAVLWRHRLADAWSFAGGVKVVTGIYDGAVREDWLTTGTASVTWHPRTGPDITATLLGDAGRDHSRLHDPTREFHRTFASVGGTWVF